MTSQCPNCTNARAARKYLCPPCWRALTPATRGALNRTGDGAIRRYQALLDQIRNRTPLGQIEIPE